VIEVRRYTTERREHAPLGRMLGQVEREVSRLLESTLATDGLTVDQWRVLDLLSDGTGHTMSGIAAAIAVPGPTLTKIVDRLVDSAAVYRLVDSRDRRRVLAFISDNGRAVHERLAPEVSAAEAAALTVLGDDAPVLLTLLARLAGQR
jgi:DNA-binding MarR family transcriptional regulator